MHILIIEAGLSGHHSVYLERVAVAYMDAGHSVTVSVLQRDSSHDAIKRLNARFKDAFNVVTLDDARYDAALHSPLGETGRELALRRIFGQVYCVVHQSRPLDYVFLPYLDYCLYAMGLLGSPFGLTHWGGICMRPTFHYKTFNVIAPNLKLQLLKRLLFNNLLKIRSLSGLFSIDELLVRYVCEHSPSVSDRLHYLPDPAELPLGLDVVELRNRYQIPSDAKVILIYGAIDERKGLLLLLDALEIKKDLSEWHVMVVGQQSTQVREALLGSRWASLKQAQRIHEIDTFVTYEVEQHVFALCDAVWVAYVGHYQMSGVLVRAGMHRKPVVACEEGLIGWYARYRGVGITVTKSLFSIVTTLNVLAERSQVVKIGEAGYKQFSKHRWSNFANILVTKLGA